MIKYYLSFAITLIKTFNTYEIEVIFMNYDIWG